MSIDERYSFDYGGIMTKKAQAPELDIDARIAAVTKMRDGFTQSAFTMEMDLKALRAQASGQHDSQYRQIKAKAANARKAANAMQEELEALESEKEGKDLLPDITLVEEEG